MLWDPTHACFSFPGDAAEDGPESDDEEEDDDDEVRKESVP